MAQPSWLERLLLLTLIFLSLTMFWLRFRRGVGIIAAARKETGFSLGPILPRVRQFVWEVLLQGKVIWQRPLPGIAHAFVFWGFCAFALVTVNHIAQGFGVTLVSRESLFGRAYFAFVAVFAVAVAISIVGLAIRRFVARPVWLGEVSPESGIIALLILTLMVTYLASFGFTEVTAAGRANWWAHTLALLIFLPLIPHTKHLHLVLSPAAIFAK